MNGDYIFVAGGAWLGGAVNNIKVYDKHTLAFVKESEPYHTRGMVEAIARDGEYIYIAGYIWYAYEQHRIKVYSLPDLEFVKKSNDSVSSHRFRKIVVTKDRIYAATGAWGSGEVQEWDKETLTLLRRVGNNTMRCIYKDGDSLFVSAIDYIYKIDIPSFTVTHQAYYGTSNKSIVMIIDEDYVYAGAPGKGIKKYTKNNLTFLIESAPLTHQIEAMAIDASHLYIGGRTRPSKYVKANLSLVGYFTWDYYETSLLIDGDYLYETEMSTMKIRKHTKHTLSLVADSPVPYATPFSDNNPECMMISSILPEKTYKSSFLTSKFIKRISG